MTPLFTPSSTLASDAPSALEDVDLDLKTDLICMVDGEGRFTSLNSAWPTLLGWRCEEMLEMSVEEIVHPDDRPDVRTVIAAAKADGCERFSLDNRCRAKDGTWYCLRWQIWLDGDSWFAVVSDVSKEKRRESELRDSLANGSLLAYSQPIFDQRLNRTVQRELLVRLRNYNNMDIALPGHFLPYAESSGLIKLIDQWMLDQALRVARANHPAEVNVSARSLEDPAFTMHVLDRLQANPKAAPHIVFEITETAVLSDFEAAVEFANRVSLLGCGFALDDFGTGYGSLTQLRHLPISCLKIDRSFVSQASFDNADQEMIRGIVALAKALALTTVAEGVEDQRTLNLLSELGVDLIQGYIIGGPAPLGEPPSPPRRTNRSSELAAAVTA